MTDTTQPHPGPQEASSLPRYTIDCSSNEYGNHWNVEGDSEGSLCLYTDVQSQLNALRTERDEWHDRATEAQAERDAAREERDALKDASMAPKETP